MFEIVEIFFFFLDFRKLGFYCGENIGLGFLCVCVVGL